MFEKSSIRFESRVMPTEMVCQPAVVRFPRALHLLAFTLEHLHVFRGRDESVSVYQSRFPASLNANGFFTIALAICFTLVGCGEKDPPLVPVSGVVTLDGKPLADATVEFVPESGWGSMGKTDDTGRYELLYRAQKKGATTGQHKVRISTKIEDDADSADPVVQKGRKESVPARYNTATTLEANVEPGESVELNFDL